MFGEVIIPKNSHSESDIGEERIMSDSNNNRAATLFRPFIFKQLTLKTGS